MSRISNKQIKTLYATCDTAEKKVYKRLIKLDITTTVHYLTYWLPYTQLDSEGTWTSQIQTILDRGDFEEMLALQTRLGETARAIERLEKHMQKLAERQTND
jgi:hypothetical protein